MKKKFVGLMMCCILALISLTGCTTEKKQVTAKSLVKDMKEATKNCESVSIYTYVDLDMDLASPADNSSTNMNVYGSFYVDASGNMSELNGIFTMDMFGTTQDISLLMYAKEGKDGAVTTYNYDESSDLWTKTTDDSMSEYIDSLEKQVDLSNIQDELKLAEKTEKIDDIECYQMTATLTGDKILEILKNEDETEDGNDSGDVDTTDVPADGNATEDSVTQEMDGIMNGDVDMSWLNVDFTIYIDKKTSLPVQIVMDFADSDMDTVAQWLSQSMGSELVAQLSTAEIEMNYDSFNEVEKIKLPKEALAAQEVTGTDSLFNFTGEGDIEGTEEDYDESDYYMDEDSYYLDDDYYADDSEL